MKRETYLANILLTWIQILSTKVPYSNQYESVEDMIRNLFAAEREYEPDVLSAIDELLTTGVAPQNLDDWTQYFFCLRLQAAADYLQQVSCLHPNGDTMTLLNEDVSNKSILETLLKPMWNEYKRDHWLKTVAVSYFANLPLYGIEPIKD